MIIGDMKDHGVNRLIAMLPVRVRRSQEAGKAMALAVELIR